jgi:23S rRNA G2069 N7-methylase RlmK/C1962 C5-methylase RlmI
MSPNLFRDHFEQALRRREAKLKKEECLRVFDGLGDGFPGLVIDKFGDVGVVHSYSESFSYEWCQTNLIESLRKVFKHAYLWGRSADNDSRNREAYLLFGDKQEQFVVHLGALKLILRPERLPQAGVFLDSLQIREFISEKSIKGRVINTFAYTGSLGLVAHLAGASEVIQIDSNSGILAWAKENFVLNRVEGGGIMRFIEDDVLDFLGKEARRIESGKREPCQMVILDPPTIGRSERGLFKVHHDLPNLIEVAIRCLGRSGYLVISLNAPDISIDTLELYLEKVIGESQRGYELVETLLPDPILYPTHPVESSVMRGIIAQIQ